MTKQEEAAKLFGAEEPPTVLVNIDKGPLPATVREALAWCMANGVASCELPNVGNFTFRPRPHIPTLEDLKEGAGLTDDKPKRKLVIGGYDPETLFAASPAPVQE